MIIDFYFFILQHFGVIRQIRTCEVQFFFFTHKYVAYYDVSANLLLFFFA